VSADRIVLSLVIPAYNEVRRLPPYLASVRTHLDARYGGDYEVIVVDDGSDDGLGDFLVRRTVDWPQLRWLRHLHNQGKGAAVRTGVLASRGSLVLFADADGATPIDQQRRLAEAIDEGADLAVGSRLVAAPDVKRSRSRARGLAGRLFAAAARWLLGIPVRDTQCGFKMFRGEVARRIFSLVREPRYLFDLEVLALASRLRCRIAEVPICWQEMPGGHLSLVRDLPRILFDLWRLHYRLRGQGLPLEESRADAPHAGPND
jgi:dolichyl-phosphate beta-glucosyltransferase